METAVQEGSIKIWSYDLWLDSAVISFRARDQALQIAKVCVEVCNTARDFGFRISAEVAPEPGPFFAIRLSGEPPRDCDELNFILAVRSAILRAFEVIP